MKLLRISDGCGEFLGANEVFQAIDRINKEDLLRITRQTIYDVSSEIDVFDEAAIKNQAHRVIYKSISQKLLSLAARRQEFVDQAARLYLDEYKQYCKV